MNPDLLRQRRNLVAISSILLVFDFANVQITKISVIGTELLVGNAHVLIVCAWVIWAYFLLRYYQYWRVEPHQPIKNTFREKIDTYIRFYTKAKAITSSAGSRYDDYRITRTALCPWCYILQGYNPKEDRSENKTIHNLPAWRLGAMIVKSALYVCFQTPHVTDCLLP